jgi:hypothetical protein
MIISTKYSGIFQDIGYKSRTSLQWHVIQKNGYNELQE